MLGPLSRLASERAGVETIAFVTWRSMLGAVVVGCLLAARSLRGRPLVAIRAMSVRARTSLLVATASGVILNLAVFLAFGRITVALALLGFYTYPALVTLAVVVIERRRPDRLQLVALMMATLGMVIVVLGGVDPAKGLTFDLLGLLLALVAAVAQTVYVLVSRHGFAAVPIDQASFTMLAGGSLGFLVIALLTGSGDAIVNPLLNPVAWPYLIAGGVFGAGIPSTLFLLGIRWIGGVRAGILALLEPVVGALLAAVILGEILQPIQAVGGALVLAAALLLQRARPRPGPAAGVEPGSRSGPSRAPGGLPAGEPGADRVPLV
jgi:DME family drug/metabolite transporter